MFLARKLIKYYLCLKRYLMAKQIQRKITLNQFLNSDINATMKSLKFSKLSDYIIHLHYTFKGVEKPNFRNNQINSPQQSPPVEERPAS